MDRGVEMTMTQAHIDVQKRDYGGGVAAGKMKVLLEVGRLYMDRGVELTMIHTYINIQKCDFGG